MAKRQSRMAGPRASIVLVALLVALALPALAQAASRPTVSTGSAKQVSFGSALLTGSVNPNGANTSYYFQYGPTRALGFQSAIADAGGGTRNVKVSIGISGLQPLTMYHYRLVAVNGAGATIGAERSFLTLKVPLSLQILASPNPVLFGGTVVVQGTLSGTGNASRAVTLQANAFPFTAGFQNVGNAQLTTVNTQFRVVTTAKPVVISPVATESVAVRVSSHVGRTRRAHFARFFGTVTPAEDGAEVGILRITRGHGVLVGGTRLRHRNATSSKFSRVVPVRRGVYRVLVRVINGPQVSNYGLPLVIR